MNLKRYKLIVTKDAHGVRKAIGHSNDKGQWLRYHEMMPILRHFAAIEHEIATVYKLRWNLGMQRPKTMEGRHIADEMEHRRYKINNAIETLEGVLKDGNASKEILDLVARTLVKLS